MDKAIESQRSSRIGIFKSKGGSRECRLEKVVQCKDQYVGNKKIPQVKENSKVDSETFFLERKIEKKDTDSSRLN